MENLGLPTIPQYFKQYVDANIDLEATPHIACPFHNETSGQSFSYSAERGIWRCFGACHCGGDVIELHRLNFKLKDRDTAEAALCKLLGIKIQHRPLLKPKEIEVDESDVERRRIYAKALRLAKNPDDWDELDYILSKVPYDVKELEMFCNIRK